MKTMYRIFYFTDQGKEEILCDTLENAKRIKSMLGSSAILNIFKWRVEIEETSGEYSSTTLMKELKRKIDYARCSYSIRLMYEVKGNFDTAYEYNRLTQDEFQELNKMCVVECLNNGVWMSMAT